MNIVLHSYTFRGYSVERAFYKAAEYGYDGIELSTVHFKTEADIQKAVALSKKFQVPIASIDGGTDLLNEANANASIEKMKWLIDMAAKYDIPIINGGIANKIGTDGSKYGENGSVLLTDADYEYLGQKFQDVAKYAEENKILIVFEIHMNTPHDTGASTLKLLELIDSEWVKANPDPGNIFAITSSEGPYAAVEKVRGRIGYFHAKNCRKTALGNGWNYSYLLENGSVDYYRIVCQLVEQGFDGSICIEYCGEGDPAFAAAKDIVYLRGLIKDALLSNCLK
ncbi:MAG: sugar phosphate isomerase/epimerase [Firmicutes bacterium]|nr:sugar phosphate isomerase/epimerase [Bacillota bacterium]